MLKLSEVQLSVLTTCRHLGQALPQGKWHIHKLLLQGGAKGFLVHGLLWGSMPHYPTGKGHNAVAIIAHEHSLPMNLVLLKVRIHSCLSSSDTVEACQLPSYHRAESHHCMSDVAVPAFN